MKIEPKEGYKRCGICDYCELNSPTNRNISFTYDPVKDQFICSECSFQIQDSLSEFEVNDDTDKWLEEFEMEIKKTRPNNYRFDPKRNVGIISNIGGNVQGRVTKVTLPKVTGVNEGPTVDIRSMSVVKDVEKKNK